MHKFGHHQSSATMHQWFGEWSATYASNRHASPRHRDIAKNFNACIEIFSYVSTPNTIGDMNSAMQSANIRRCTPRPKMSHSHRRCSCKHRRCIFDVIISPMVWWSIADPSPMFPSCSAKHRRCYGDASLSVMNLPSDWSPMITWTLL